MKSKMLFTRRVARGRAASLPTLVGDIQPQFRDRVRVGVFEGTRYLDESPKYKAVGAMGWIRLEWGGSWKSFKDEPHFQLRPRCRRDQRKRDAGLNCVRGESLGKGYYA